jgi:hypothetical protein
MDSREIPARPKGTPHLLVINRSDSRCGYCGRPADPYEKRHDTINDWGRKSEGCHTRFVLLTSHYIGDGIKRAATEMRPDLEWVQ